MPICEKCGEDKPRRGFVLHVKSCIGKNTIPDNTIDESAKVKSENMKSLTPINTVDESSKVDKNAMPDNTIDDLSKVKNKPKVEINDYTELEDINDENVKSLNPDNTNERTLEIVSKTSKNTIPDNTIDESGKIEENTNPYNTIHLEIDDLKKEISEIRTNPEMCTLRNEMEFLKSNTAKVSSKNSKEIEFIKKSIVDINEKINSNNVDEIKELKIELAQPLSNPEIKKLKESVSELGMAVEKVKTPAIIQAENQKPKTNQQIAANPRVVSDGVTWNDMAMEALFIIAVFLILLWVFL